MTARRVSRIRRDSLVDLGVATRRAASGQRTQKGQADRHVANASSLRTGGLVVLLATLVAFLPWLSAIENGLHAVLCALQLLICSYGILLSVWDGLRPISLIFFTFCFGWVGMGATYQLAHGKVAWDDTVILSQDSVLTAALLLNVVAFSSFIIGTGLKQKQSPLPANRSAVRIRRFPIWLYIGVAVVLLPLVVRTVGGFHILFSSRSDRYDAVSAAGVSLAESGGASVALVGILPAALSISAAFLSILRVRDSWSRKGFMRIQVLDLTAMLLSLGLVVIYCNPMANSRFLFILAFGSIALALWQPRSPAAAKWVAFVALIGMTLVYPLADIFRRGFESARAVETGLEVFAGNDFDAFQQVANAFIFTEERGHSFGHYISSAVLYFVPRSIWEDKATPASIDVAMSRNYDFTNLSLPIHAEIYIEFGVVGVVVLLFMLGLFCARADVQWLTLRRTKLAVLAPVFAMAMWGLIRGPLGSLAPIYGTAILLIWFGLRTLKSQPIQRDDLAGPNR